MTKEDTSVKLVDLTNHDDESHVVIFLKGNQAKPKIKYIWAMHCRYCGGEFNSYRFLREDRHHHCGKKCVDRSRNRSHKRKSVKEQIPIGLSGHIAVTSEAK